MRKRIIGTEDEAARPTTGPWLPLHELAEVEITSEDPTHPIEAALISGRNAGWRAAAPGKQTIRLRFAKPQRLHRIHLKFVEADVERSQEYVVRWSPDDGHSFREVLKQQWNFSPNGATSQVEDHQVALDDVTVLELVIDPDKGKGSSRASLTQLRLA